LRTFVVGFKGAGALMAFCLQSTGQVVGSIDLPETPFVGAKFGRNPHSPTGVITESGGVHVCACQYAVASDRAFAWAATLLEGAHPDLMVVLDSSVDVADPELGDAPVVWSLATDAARGRMLALPAPLPAPLMLSGPAAALLQWSQVRGLAAVALVARAPRREDDLAAAACAYATPLHTLLPQLAAPGPAELQRAAAQMGPPTRAHLYM
jgi:predicted ATP-grasp superfamily ATP-dependent carboligase